MGKEDRYLMDYEGKFNIKEILEWVYCVVIAVILALLVRYYLGTPTIVQMSSMHPTLQQGQRLILNRWIRTTNQTPKRGDIITFEAPSKTSGISAAEADIENPIAVYENEPTNIFSKFRYYVLEIGKTSYIKRVIALPGEHIKIENGKVYINGEQLQENYLNTGVTTPLTGPYTDLVVPQGYVFAMGDNRAGSKDCREFGCVPIEKIESKVWIRFWPFSLFGKVD